MLAVMRGGIIISETTFLLLMCIIECIVWFFQWLVGVFFHLDVDAR